MASPSVAYTPDADGNLATRTEASVTRTFTFDATNRLIEVEDGATTIAEYRYDPFGRRIRKTVSGDTTHYLWDGDQLLAEYDGSSGDRLRRYAYAGGFAPVQVVMGAGGECSDSIDNDGDSLSDTSDPDCTSASDPTEGTELSVHTDHLDTPRMLTDASGTPVWRADYEAFGRAYVSSDPDGNPGTPDPGITFNIRFPGQYHDAESGLHYNRWRYYDPGTGRYISADPIGQYAIFTAPEPHAWFGVPLRGLLIPNPDFLRARLRQADPAEPGEILDFVQPNLYSYVIADPVNLEDPEGLFNPLGWIAGQIAKALTGDDPGCGTFDCNRDGIPDDADGDGVTDAVDPDSQDPNIPTPTTPGTCRVPQGPGA